MVPVGSFLFVHEAIELKTMLIALSLLMHEVT